VEILWGGFSALYFALYAFYNVRARLRLEKLPYNRFRTGNLLQSWQVGSLTCMVTSRSTQASFLSSSTVRSVEVCCAAAVEAFAFAGTR
jgi:hypothetical protein